MAGIMAEYLENEVADYTATELAVRPQEVLPERRRLNQAVHEFDDGSREVVDMGGAKSFEVQLKWTRLGETDARTIADFFWDSSKANGQARTFYWQHPRDGYTYTARFGSDLSKMVKPANRFEVPSVSLVITGVKP